LKELGGPFTAEREVEEYLGCEAVLGNEKDKRVYLELRYLRDTIAIMPLIK
jgi:hypothetical protein